MSIAEDRDPDDPQVVDPRDAAESAGLWYVTDEDQGIRRQKAGKGFSYRGPDGRKITNTDTLDRIKALAIPPAYTHVWISERADGHIQATGRDAKGRKQYRYHPLFREIRDSAKYEHVTAFADALPHIRDTVRRHMAEKGLSRRKILATIVYLLETTLIRVGNEDYARKNQSYGLTTLLDEHVAVDGAGLHFEFKGKSGKMWRLDVRNKRVAAIVKACHDLPGHHLFQFLDDDKQRHSVGSSDVNSYLREITGRDVTAKDFRTWAGTVLAAMALHEIGIIDSEAKAKKNIRAAIERVSSRLGNTPTICRKCYIHPEILNCYMSGELMLEIKDDIEAELRSDLPKLRPEEAAVLALLESRLKRDIDDAAAEAAKQASAPHRKGSRLQPSARDA
ncbi:DNA topoisomerase IB [Lichenihabitans psoromatis]|uniref:DNA topoisomerase IB n=1 Tax=Lichenihabitans psoromatis TaxID=2528642 RepID=UPI0010357F6D|nr:DNA topoisomerase IB [Lichenihabitans psoromatis]